MSDFRKFCWGTFVGLGGTAMLFNFGVEQTPDAPATPGEAVIAMGLALGCFTVILFGKRGDAA